MLQEWENEKFLSFSYILYNRHSAWVKISIVKNVLCIDWIKKMVNFQAWWWNEERFFFFVFSQNEMIYDMYGTLKKFWVPQ